MQCNPKPELPACLFIALSEQLRYLQLLESMRCNVWLLKKHSPIRLPGSSLDTVPGETDHTEMHREVAQAVAPARDMTSLTHC